MESIARIADRPAPPESGSVSQWPTHSRDQLFCVPYNSFATDIASAVRWPGCNTKHCNKQSWHPMAIRIQRTVCKLLRALAGNTGSNSSKISRVKSKLPCGQPSHTALQHSMRTIISWSQTTTEYFELKISRSSKYRSRNKQSSRGSIWEGTLPGAITCTIRVIQGLSVTEY